MYKPMYGPEQGSPPYLHVHPLHLDARVQRQVARLPVYEEVVDLPPLPLQNFLQAQTVGGANSQTH